MTFESVLLELTVILYCLIVGELNARDGQDSCAESLKDGWMTSRTYFIGKFSVINMTNRYRGPTMTCLQRTTLTGSTTHTYIHIRDTVAQERKKRK